MLNLTVKRIYEEPDSTDGMRILVDRIWPRGVSKEKAQLTHWMKEAAPSTELRTWFHHLPEQMQDKFEVFKARYTAELAEGPVHPYLEQLMDWAEKDRVTLLYSAKNTQLNHATVLKEYLEELRCP